MAESPDERGTVDYLLLGHVTVDRLDDKKVAMGGTATYAALTARNMGARVGVHTSSAYEPGLIDILRGVLVARIPAEYTTCFVNEYSAGRSEEHTSELQSPCNLVCRLLLEKKKKKHYQTQVNHACTRCHQGPP